MATIGCEESVFFRLVERHFRQIFQLNVTGIGKKP